MQEKFDHALETQQRNVAEIVQKDKAQMTEIVEIMKNLNQAFSDTHKMVENFDVPCSEE